MVKFPVNALNSIEDISNSFVMQSNVSHVTELEKFMISLEFTSGKSSE